MTLRWTALVVALMVIAAACGGADRDETATDATTPPSTDDNADDASADTATDGSAGDETATDEATGDDGAGDAGADAGSDEAATDDAAVEVFGDGLQWPCGPGDAAGATEQGVSDTTIKIGGGDDRGFSGSPGLNKEQSDALEAFVARCNELGGINGRTVEVTIYDGKIFNVKEAMAEACSQVFMLVGQGWALDDQGEELRVDCEMASVPAWSVSAAFAHGPGMFQAVPNPADEQAMSQAYQVAELFPDSIANSATLYSDFAGPIEQKEKVRAAYPAAGYEFELDTPYAATGEEDWNPFVRQLASGTDDGPITHVNFTGSCFPNYQELRQTAVRNEYEAVWTTEANFYADSCAGANTDGSMDGTYIRMVFIPLEEADLNPATADFVQIVSDNGGTPSLLGMQAASSFMLWATAAQACGSDLTRQCVIDRIEQIDEWNTGGLHVPTTPRDNHAATCGMLVELQGTEYVRVVPEEPGTFDCDDSWRETIDTDAVEVARLDENRVSTLYTAG